MVEVDFSKLTADEIEDLLGSHPDTEELEIGGKTFKFWFGGASYAYAEKEGIDLGEILDPDGDVEPQSLESLFEEVQKLLLVGLKPLQPDITLTKLAFLLSTQERMRLTPKLMNAIYGVGLEDAQSALQKQIAESGKKKDSN